MIIKYIKKASPGYEAQHTNLKKKKQEKRFTIGASVKRLDWNYRHLSTPIIITSIKYILGFRGNRGKN